MCLFVLVYLCLFTCICLYLVFYFLMFAYIILFIYHILYILISITIGVVHLRCLAVYIRESVDSLCRDGTDTPIVCVH